MSGLSKAGKKKITKVLADAVTKESVMNELLETEEAAKLMDTLSLSKEDLKAILVEAMPVKKKRKPPKKGILAKLDAMLMEEEE
jgi:hypothetical protein